MDELLRRVAAVDPARVAVVTHDGTRTYGQLADDALRVAAALTERGIRRFAIAEVEAAAVLPLLAGASLAGAEACQYPPDAPDDLRSLVERFDHDVLVTDRDDLAGLAPQVLGTGALLGGASDPSVVVDPTPTDDVRPHLVLTTGTTGAPRGVRHDWNRLVRGTARVRPAPDERWLLAFGLHQFAGLQVLLHVAAAGSVLVAPAPRRPVEGLEAMRALGVTHASATPTYWRFLVAQLRSDGGPVPALRQVTLGGEAIPGPLLGELRATFPDAAVSQVYAASEFGSTGSMRDGRPGLSIDVLDRGDDADVDMRIVDGELWIRSRTGMLGYHGEPPIEADGWRATGDRVEIEGDRVLFRGRTSEIINVGGVKVHPLPIEERVAAVDGVVMARVYGRPNAMTGAIVALEVVAAPGTDEAELKTALKAACADLVPASRPRSITFVDEIVTTGSKILRREL
ncbi:MAG: class I adenylate-forming enzyme family protein [Aeromicrobium sp.]|uniref:class I adenylate-forming enzyme family protein n=1 Tax=Aeromicrobium sp. TaxID=1871063 RepID=UPI0025B9DE9C|nr:class I adenylate-forming enzyme family protein [Aeromicrobium sp.]MCK5891557.1 acyl--CoA ligase [Aeromicrobium sp.]MDF1704797.1 class I adenylate-forming enzyme family protein [Aeromicrobium sp.]